METTTANTILKIRGISKEFPGVQALKDASLEVLEGEIHGVVGKNGAGKSTLMAVLMGLQQPSSGEIEVNGHVFTAMNPHEALEAGIAYVPQHVSMMDSLTVAENILAGEMPVNKLGFVDWNLVYEDADQRLEKAGSETGRSGARRGPGGRGTDHAGNRESPVQQCQVDYSRRADRSPAPGGYRPPVRVHPVPQAELCRFHLHFPPHGRGLRDLRPGYHHAQRPGRGHPVHYRFNDGRTDPPDGGRKLERLRAGQHGSRR